MKSFNLIKLLQLNILCEMNKEIKKNNIALDL